MSKRQWFPLESNQDVMNKYIEGMGVDTSKLQFCEVLSLEDWALDMVPRPCAAVLMVYPIKESSEAHKEAQAAQIAANGQVVSPNLRYIKQTIGNACGTIGILHALSNVSGSNSDLLEVKDGSYLSKYLAETASMSGAEIAEYLDNDDELESTHEAAAAEGSSAVPDDNTSVNTHFVCFTARDGHLYELDGRKNGPVNHGDCGDDKVLEGACKVIQGFMDRDPGEVRFTIAALAAPAAF